MVRTIIKKQEFKGSVNPDVLNAPQKLALINNYPLVNPRTQNPVTTPAPTTQTPTTPTKPPLTNQFGQTRADIQAIQLERDRMNAGTGAKELMAQQQVQQTQQAALDQVSQGIGLTPEQIANAEAQGVNVPVDWGQALTAGTVKNAPSLLTNIAGGAVLGAATAAPISAGLAATGVGAIPAGVIIAGAAAAGAIKSIWGGVQSNIASQQKGEIGASQNVLSAAKTNMRLIATLAAKDPANAQRYADAYDTQLAQVYTARRSIFLETQGNLNKFTEDGVDILSEFDLFLEPMGKADIYKIKLQMAISSGVIPDFTEEDLAAVL